MMRLPGGRTVFGGSGLSSSSDASGCFLLVGDLAAAVSGTLTLASGLLCASASTLATPSSIDLSSSTSSFGGAGGRRTAGPPGKSRFGGGATSFSELVRPIIAGRILIGPAPCLLVLVDIDVTDIAPSAVCPRLDAVRAGRNGPGAFALVPAVLVDVDATGTSAADI